MRPEPLTKDKINFENLVENYQVKIVNPISFENTDKQGYPIWSFKLNNDKNLNPDCDYILISRLELIRLFKERVQYLLKEIEKEKNYFKRNFKKINESEKLKKIEEGKEKPKIKALFIPFVGGYVEAESFTLTIYEHLCWFEDLIKKAFKGVLEK